MDRREFLATIGYSFLFYTTAGISSISKADSDFLDEDLGTSSILAPDKFSELSAQELVRLRKFAEFIRNEWELPAELNSWERMVSSKVKKAHSPYNRNVFPPSSYYSEYIQAIQTLEKLSGSYGVNDALKEIFQLDAEIASNPGFKRTRRGHIREYVISEFSYAIVRDGGFRKFGYTNYRAYIRGALQDATPGSANWPYKIYEGERTEFPTGKVYEMPLLGEEI